MAIIKEAFGKAPKWGKDCYFSETASVVGEVTMGCCSYHNGQQM